MKVEIRTSRFKPWSEVDRHEQNTTPATIGACAVFTGTMRNFNEGSAVSNMTLEYYPGMTERQLKRIVQSQCQVHQLEDVLVIHRVGDILPGETIVLVACWACHRKQAFEACRTIMEELKHRAPFWKKEQTDQGERWVETNTAG